MTDPSHARRWSSDHPHGNRQRAQIVETARVRPGDLDGKPIPRPWTLWTDVRGGTGAVGTAPKRAGPLEEDQAGWPVGKGLSKNHVSFPLVNVALPPVLPRDKYLHFYPWDTFEKFMVGYLRYLFPKKSRPRMRAKSRATLFCAGPRTQYPLSWVVVPSPDCFQIQRLYLSFEDGTAIKFSHLLACAYDAVWYHLTLSRSYSCIQW
jgi:hypothetical protein